MVAKKKEATSETKKSKSLEAALANIRKTYGEDAVMIMDEDSSLPEVERISSGIPVMDKIMGGGWPKGRIIEVYGPESSGKTTVCLTAIASAQKEGLTCAFIDMEHALDPVYAQAIGVDLKKLIVSQPDSGEMALEITDSLVSTGEVGLAVVDSVAALTPKAEIDGDMGDAHVGLLPRLMSQGMRKLMLSAANAKCPVLFINQIREKVGGYGNPETTPGGRALKFFSSVRLDIRKKDKLTEGGEAIGNHTVVKTVKNKTFPPFRECSFNIIFGKGVDVLGSMVDIAVDKDIINKSGAWFTYDGQRFQGRTPVVEYFRDNPEAQEKLKAQLAEAEE